MERDILHKALLPISESLTLDKLVNLFYNEFLAIEEFDKLRKGISAGKKISLLFNPHRLDTPTITNSTTIYKALKDPHLLDGFARMVCYDLSVGAGDPFYHSCRRGFNGVQLPDEFPPYVARCIYSEFGGKSGLKVLDPCCGWGGRMIGCASLPNMTYIGCEPSTKTYEGLCKLGEWLKSLQPSFNFTLYNTPYEDFNCDEVFDIALTSPPYYDTELYSDEDTNSCNRYDTYDKWVIGFYEPLIVNTVNRLSDTATFILNVGDRKYALSESLYEICEKHGFAIGRTYDFLSGNGEGKEKFYSIGKTKTKVFFTNALF